MGNRLVQTCRIALAAYLHDLGKFAERARIEEAWQKDEGGNTRKAINEQMYCPHWNGRPTHIHAAFTSIGMDVIEEWLPEIARGDQTPFAEDGRRAADDSLINAAARHHRPDTYLQWVVATADRLASGFEREEFEAYNQTEDADEKAQLNHYTTRQWTLLEEIEFEGKGARQVSHRYPLKPLSPNALFPVPASDRAEGEHGDSKRAQGQYRELWKGFAEGIRRIPASHRSQLPLWLDHFDTLWMTYAQAIPSATAGVGTKRTKPNVSLYDHSRTTAALATALWRHDVESGVNDEAGRESLRAMWDRMRAGSPAAEAAWRAPRFLLVQGDFFGIQNFIFSDGGQTQKRAAKLLRGRSFYVSLLTELAALKVLEALELPSTSQVVNAAGKFLIVAPNTPETRQKLAEVQSRLDAWFLEHTFGTSGIGLAWLEAAPSDFRHGGSGDSPFRGLMQRLFRQLDVCKLQRFGLCGEKPPVPVFEGFLDRFKEGECRVDGRSPAERMVDGEWVSRLAADQIRVGHLLANRQVLVVSNGDLAGEALDLRVFGYQVGFVDLQETEAIGRGGSEGVASLLRVIDFSVPSSLDDTAWHGLSRRSINAHVPRFTATDIAEEKAGKYAGRLDADEVGDFREGLPKTLNHLANSDRRPDPDQPDKWRGVEALMTLKGDVDNLGQIFQKGLDQPTFARMAALSRQVNGFFATYLPALCREEFPDTYTVFAGGDDFFLVGPWRQMILLARRLRTEFQRYVAGNPSIHFSAGLSMTKPGLPIRQLARMAEEALDEAKRFEGAGGPKNAVNVWGQTVPWGGFEDLVERAARLDEITARYRLSTGYVYGLLRYVDMAEDPQRPANALWHSHFAYSTRRLVERTIRVQGNPQEAEARRRQQQAELAGEIVERGIRKHGGAYRVALYAHLYQQRD